MISGGKIDKRSAPLRRGLNRTGIMVPPFESKVFGFAVQAERAATIGELNRDFGAVIRAFGFQWWASVWLRTQSRHSAPPIQRVYGEPASQWWDRYKSQRYGDDDPAVHEVLRSDTPILEEDARKRGPNTQRVRQICGEAVEFGVGHGIACSVRLANGEVWGVGLLGRDVDSDPAFKSGFKVLASTYTVRALALTVQRDGGNSPVQLTPRMREIVSMLRHGETQSSIASRLGISTRTVEHLVHDARERLGARTTSELIAEAMNAGEVGEFP